MPRSNGTDWHTQWAREKSGRPCAGRSSWKARCFLEGEALQILAEWRVRGLLQELQQAPRAMRKENHKRTDFLRTQEAATSNAILPIVWRGDDDSTDFPCWRRCQRVTARSATSSGRRGPKRERAYLPRARSWRRTAATLSMCVWIWPLRWLHSIELPRYWPLNYFCLSVEGGILLKVLFRSFSVVKRD